MGQCGACWSSRSASAFTSSIAVWRERPRPGAILAILHRKVFVALVLPFFALLTLCAALNSRRTKRVLNSRPFRFLGDISYSVYLLQRVWIWVWSVWFDLHWKVANPDRQPSYGELLLWLAQILISIIGSAALTYHFVEMPCRNGLAN